MKLKEKQRNVLIVVIIFAIIITTVGFIQFTGFMIFHEDTGGDNDVTYVPPEPEPEPEPLPDVDPPIEPILNIIAGPSITGEVHISWSSVSDADDYGVYRSDDEVSYDFLGKVYTTSYDDLIEIDGTYYYRIKAGNEGGTSDFSNVEYVIIDIPGIPNIPEVNEISYEIIDSGIEIIVSWNEINCDTYNLYKEIITESKSTGFVLIEEGLISTSYSEVLTDVGKYTYKISAVNDIGESEQSNPTTINISNEGVTDESNDYIWLYVLLIIFGVVVVPVALLTRRNKRKNK